MAQTTATKTKTATAVGLALVASAIVAAGYIITTSFNPGTVTISLPDLAIQDIVYKLSTSDTQIAVKIVNKGVVSTTQPFQISGSVEKANKAGVVSSSTTYSSILGPKKTTTVIVHLGPINEKIVQIVAMVDSQNVISESEESNNTTFLTL